jgi:hypothetical protein
MSFDTIKPKRHVKVRRKHYYHDSIFVPQDIEVSVDKSNIRTRRFAFATLLFLFLQMVGPFYVPSVKAAGVVGPNLITNGTFSSSSNFSYSCTTPQDNWCVNSVGYDDTKQAVLGHYYSPTDIDKTVRDDLLLVHEYPNIPTSMIPDSGVTVAYRASLTPGKQYQLKFSYDTSSTSSKTGNYFNVINGSSYSGFKIADTVNPTTPVSGPMTKTYNFIAESSYISFTNRSTSGMPSHDSFTVMIDNVTLYEYDTIPPSISTPNVTPDINNSTVTWTTNESAATSIQYGLSTSTYGSYVQATPSGTSHNYVLNNLLENTTYYYQIRATDGATNVGYKTGSFKTLDGTPPSWISSLPTVSFDTIATNINLSAGINEDGIIYYGVYPNNATEPTVSQLKQGTGALSGKFGTIPVLANVPMGYKVTGLAQGTAYDVYFVAADTTQSANTQDIVILREITTQTLPQLAPPIFTPDPGVYGSNQTISISSEGSQSVKYTTDGTTPDCASSTTYTASIDASASTGQEVIYSIKAIACSADTNIVMNSQVVDFTIKIDKQPPTIGSVFNVTVNKLTASFDALTGGGNPVSFIITETTGVPAVDAAWSAVVISYTALTDGVRKLYAWAKDAAGNVSSYSETADIIFDATAPYWAVGYPKAEPLVENNLYVSTGVQLSVKASEGATVYYGVYEKDSLVPNSDQVVTGDQTISGASGNVVLADANGVGNINIDTLEPNTDYDVYFVAKDSSSSQNLQDSPTKLSVKTVESSVLPAPALTPVPGALSSPQNLTIQTVEGGEARYTLDGSNPTCATGNVYSSPILIDAEVTVKAIACKSLYEDSVVSGGLYTFDTEAPVMTDFALGAVSGLTVVVTSMVATGSPIAYLITESAEIPLLSAPWKSLIDLYTSFVDGTKKIFAWARDEAGNISQPLESTENVVFDSKSPDWVSSFPKAEPLVSGSVYYADRISLSVKASELSRVYYGVYANNAAAPSIMDLVDGVGAITGKSGIISPVDSSAISSINVTGLTSSTDYDVYFVAEDEAPTPNLQAQVTKVDVKTGSAFSLNYNSNGAGSGSVPTQTGLYSVGTKAVVLGNTGGLVKNGFSFGGWTLGQPDSGAVLNAGDQVLMDAPKTLYAKWVSVSGSEFKNGDLTESKSGSNVVFDKLPTLPVGQESFNVSVINNVVTVNPIPQGKAFVSVYSITPSVDLSGDYLATITLDYPSGKLAQNSDTVLYWDAVSKTWSSNGINVTERSGNKITFTTNHFTDFGIFGNISGHNGVSELPRTGSGIALIVNIMIKLVLSIGFVLFLARATKRSRYGYILN